MSTAMGEKTSALTEFFSSIPETRREILMGVICKANASQRDVVQKATALKATKDSAPPA
ncbi:hypothetical protein J2Y74_001231 [Pseudomonas migulae]|nr:hypothetical protein [Pseudomonas migulae]